MYMLYGMERSVMCVCMSACVYGFMLVCLVVAVSFLFVCGLVLCMSVCFID